MFENLDKVLADIEKLKKAHKLLERIFYERVVFAGKPLSDDLVHAIDE